ncbi:MAG: glycosyltransferase family 2 protein [Rhodothermales bacterium]|nr:glycosyltransferase family 2 protein [Rhodothermales bacterium]
MTDRQSIAIIIPVYNEEAVLPALIEQLNEFRSSRPVIDNIIFVDDGSEDNSAEIICELTAGTSGYTLLRLSRNFGHQLAITAGINAATADAAVIMDADLQDPLHVLDDMILEWQNGYDVVYGIREDRHGESFLKKKTAELFYSVFKKVANIDAPRNVGDFRLVSRKVMDAFAQIREQQPFVRGLMSWVGFRQTGVTYTRPERAAGRSKYSFRKSWNLAIDGIISFSDRPLRYAVRLGLLVSTLSILGLVWIVAEKFFDSGTIPGWASIIFAAFFFGGLQLFFLGIVGEYLARVYAEVKGRPRYIVMEKWYSDDAERRVTGDRDFQPATSPQ